MKNWMVLMATGAVALIGGLLALFNPTGAVQTSSTIVGWVLLIVGAMQVYAFWKAEGFKTRFGPGVIAAVALVMAILLLFGPFGDGSFVRFMLALLLLVSGGAKIWSARDMKGEDAFLPVLIAGAVSVLLGVVILTGFPGFLATAIGILLAIELLSIGVFLILIGRRRQKLGTA
ncbi:HdeD family acid-resistance protein [Pseudooceanicola algae]|uniref:Acid-resistance membrane protein n=1 Tax=Pseudooceanicola algae TaxID=1537215 RepID=A0A418SEI1_9RHOB|nr:DUF308 domain-containing protein [Pseudooceanicola algae]QPM89715.1 hypothetical protein PSAL_009410 [Pseudooceanicola algae]